MSLKRGDPSHPFDPEKGKRYLDVLCPFCLPDREIMECKPVVAHGPASCDQHEQIEEPSYDYACARCGLTLNFRQRVTG